MFLKVLIYVSVSLAVGEKTKMYVRRARMEDQASASSGYMYHSTSNGPTSWVHFTGSTGDSKLEYPGHLGHYGNEYSEYYSPEDYARYYAPLEHLYDSGLSEIDTAADRYAYGKEIDNSNYVHGGGHEYGDAKYANKGESGISGYKNNDAYDKGAKGKHDEEQHKGYYNQKGGDKENKHEVSEHYGSQDDSSKGSKGSSHSESSSHKKGSKTTGFHKVYHKDEFKKDHTFYDESDQKGHFHKYDNADAQHASKSGQFEKGAKEAAGFQENNGGVQGSYDKGHYDVSDGKFRGAEGQLKTFIDHAEYSKADGKGDEESFGFKKGGYSYYP